MFSHHNFNTKLAYWTLALSSVFGAISLSIITSQLLPQGNTNFISGLVLFLTVILCLNTYFAYRVYKLSKKALVLCLWLYGFQIIGFETQYLSFSSSFGFQINISWSFDNVTLSVNLTAILICFVLYKALKSLRKQS